MLRSCFLLIFPKCFGPGVSEGVGADAFLFLLFAHVVLHVAFAGGVAFGFELLVEAVEFFAEAAGAGIDAFVAVADDGEAFVAFSAAGSLESLLARM